jgi:hypothetical protein
MESHVTQVTACHSLSAEQWKGHLLKWLKDGLYLSIIWVMKSSRVRAVSQLFVLHDRLKPQEDPQKRPAKIEMALCYYLVVRVGRYS